MPISDSGRSRSPVPEHADHRDDDAGGGYFAAFFPLDKSLHTDVSTLYSSIRHSITQSYTQTVRQWLSTQSYEAQREFGLLAIENVRKGFW